MDLEANKNGAPDPTPHHHTTSDAKPLETHDSSYFPDDPDSSCSTPYVSAPSSPGRGQISGGFFYSCPASPMHFAITTTSSSSHPSSSVTTSPDRNGSSFGYEFEFSAKFGVSGSGQPGSMSSADELFLNGQIRPMKLGTHLERPQVLAPLLDVEDDEEESEDCELIRRKGRDFKQLRDRSLRRRTRSLSPLRSNLFDENENEEGKSVNSVKIESFEEKVVEGMKDNEEGNNVISSASSSRSSSAGRNNSKRWVFLKDFLYRSKSEGRSNNKFWSNISFSPAKDKKCNSSSVNTTTTASASSEQHQQKEKKNSSGNGSNSKPVNGVGKRRVPASPHELHYKASRAQAEEMRKKTYLPYRQGLLGCLGFSSKSYGAMNGFARALNPVSSR